MSNFVPQYWLNWQILLAIFNKFRRRRWNHYKSVHLRKASHSCCCHLSLFLIKTAEIRLSDLTRVQDIHIIMSYQTACETGFHFWVWQLRFQFWVKPKSGKRGRVSSIGPFPRLEKAFLEKACTEAFSKVPTKYLVQIILYPCNQNQLSPIRSRTEKNNSINPIIGFDCKNMK